MAHNFPEYNRCNKTHCTLRVCTQYGIQCRKYVCLAFMILHYFILFRRSRMRLISTKNNKKWTDISYSLRSIYAVRFSKMSICFIFSNVVELQWIRLMINGERLLLLIFFLISSVFVATLNYQCKGIKWQWWMNFGICSQRVLSKAQSFRWFCTLCVCMSVSRWSVRNLHSLISSIYAAHFISICSRQEFPNAKNT